MLVLSLVVPGSVLVAAGARGGVAVARHGHPTTSASSDEHAARYDEAQYQHDVRPSLAAMRTGKIVLIEDLAEDDESTHDLPLALGLRSAMSLPLDGGAHAAGSLDLYSRQTNAFSPTVQAEAKRLASEASRALNLTARRAYDREITEQLRAALASRTVIDQGIGIIMGQNRCDADTAFAVLRAASQRRNVKLRVVSAELITAVTHRTPRQGRRFQG